MYSFWGKLSIYLAIVSLFTVLNYTLSQSGNHYNVGKLNLIDSMYFTFTSLGAIGYGDIYPISTPSKLLVSLMTLKLVWFILL